MTTTNASVAMTILDQLTFAPYGKGINRVSAMLGAANINFSHNSVSFSFKGSRKFNGVHIVLNGKDTYDVTMIKRRWNPETNDVSEDIYAEDLSRLFNEKTGLYTYL